MRQVYWSGGAPRSNKKDMEFLYRFISTLLLITDVSGVTAKMTQNLLCAYVQFAW